MAGGANQERLPNGEAAAAIVAAGVGISALGLFTVLAAALGGFKDAMNFYGPAGPLSGKTTLAVAVWLIAWGGLHYRWRKKDVEFTRWFTIGLVLIGVGAIGTFPKFFDLFSRG